MHSQASVTTAVETLAQSFARPPDRAGRSGLRARASRPQRADRSAARARRALPGRRRRRGCGPARPRPVARDRGPRRRPQRRRTSHGRRRPDDRPVGHARHPRGPAGAAGGRPGRCALARRQPRDTGPRARHHRRRRRHDRRGRADARRRARLADVALRHGARQPGGRHRRHRRRACHPGERHRRAGPLLGDSRRRRELRRGHVVRVRVAPGRADRLRRVDRVPLRRGAVGAARLARSLGPGVRRPDDGGGAADVARRAQGRRRSRVPPGDRRSSATRSRGRCGRSAPSPWMQWARCRTRH